MALITCPECGREISDKAVSCPGCGCLVAQENKSDDCELTDAKGSRISIHHECMEILTKKGRYVPSDYIGNYKLLYTKPATIISHGIIVVSHFNAKKSICLYMPQSNSVLFYQLTGVLQKYCEREECTFNEAVNYKPSSSLTAQRELKEYRKIQGAAAINMISGNNKTPHCPKCRSTQITYGGNRISLSRAVVGGAVAGPAGATLGGLTGKKGYAVCLNCGKRWKI